MEKTTKIRVILFLTFAFAISWGTGIVIYITGGLDNGPSYMIENVQISLAQILLASCYMFGPAIANILTRILTREGSHDLYLRPRFDHKRWIYYLFGWFFPGVFVLLGMVFFFIQFPAYFDPELTVLSDKMAAVATGTQPSPWLVIVVQTLQAMLISPLLNALPTFGEEFGWRGYLQPKLMPLGSRQAIVLTGIIWGVWHWPIILMGYNYGNDYFGAPFLGPLAMLWFTLTLSALFGWITIKAGSVWPAVIAHGALNGIASLGILLVKGNPSTLLGPTPVGFLGGLGFTIAAVVIFILPKALKPCQYGQAFRRN
ncbi:MAG: CPBP family intramembrane glutamic endopeptidase [Anaerolineales bacterium]